MPRDVNDSSLPPWVGAASRLITRHGLATLFACVLLWLIVFKLPDALGSYLAAQTEATKAVHLTLEGHIEATGTRGEQAREYERQSLTLQLLTCVNTAKTRAAEEVCKAVLR